MMQWHGIWLLGVYHGINPGMGWLFAVALGMQQGSAVGVWRAIPPIALGHAAAVGTVLALAAAAETVVPVASIRVVVALVLSAFGLYRLWRHRHPAFGGMQVGFRDLTIWSFLMASAHGAGFMILPLVMSITAEADASTGGHAHGTAAAAATWPMSAALLIHTGAYLLVMAVLAWVVYRYVGLAILRRAWVNLDWLWACVLVVTGVAVLVV